MSAASSGLRIVRWVRDAIVYLVSNASELVDSTLDRLPDVASKVICSGGGVPAGAACRPKFIVIDRVYVCECVSWHVEQMLDLEKRSIFAP